MTVNGHTISPNLKKKPNRSAARTGGNEGGGEPDPGRSPAPAWPWMTAWPGPARRKPPRGRTEPPTGAAGDRVPSPMPSSTSAVVLMIPRAPCSGGPSAGQLLTMFSTAAAASRALMVIGASSCSWPCVGSVAAAQTEFYAMRGTERLISLEPRKGATNGTITPPNKNWARRSRSAQGYALRA